MRFLIVIPAHNEAEFIVHCLTSLHNQSYRDYQVMIVNDGSTDGTQNRVEAYIQDKPKFSLLNLPNSQHSPGAKVVQAFNYGVAQVNLSDFDIICKFDADIIFPPNYLSVLNKMYEENPRLGMAAGIVKITRHSIPKNNLLDFNDKTWTFEDISSKNHIRGPIKSYRIECYKAMNGLRPMLGWDNVDVMLCEINGWQTKTDIHLWVKHLRPTMFKYKEQKAKKLGQYFYNIGLSFPLALLSALKSAYKDQSIKSFWGIMRSFLSQKHERLLTAQEIKAIRKWRWKKIVSLFSKI